MKRKTPKQVIAQIEYEKERGFSKAQATSLAWAEFFEEQAAQIEYKYQGNVSASYQFDCFCKTCQKGHVFHCADSVRLFIWDHKGHETKTMRVK